jgi:DNA-binding SARP family transcriptional activator
VLALLLVHANEVVSTDRLIDGLWSGEAPASAQKVLQGYVSQLRRTLPAETIATRGSGYVLATSETDAREFERLVDAASALGPAEAAPLLRRALGLWRGPALAEFEYEDWAQAQIARLHEQRLVALEERIEADLELGRHSQVVAELEVLVAEHPCANACAGSSWSRSTAVAGKQTRSAQATEVLLAAIAESDGTRGSVLRHLFAERVRGLRRRGGGPGAERPRGSRAAGQVLAVTRSSPASSTRTRRGFEPS